MKRLGLLIACSAWGCCAFGQASKARVDAIWEAANDRISQQASIWFDDGNFETSIELLIYENNLFPVDYDIASNLGWMQENVEDWTDAQITYERFRRLNPHDPDNALMEGQFFFMRKQYAKVPPLLAPAILNPKAHPNNFRILAHAYERLGRLDDAKQTWNRYISLAPSDLTAKVNLKRVESKLAKKAAGAG